MVAVPKTAQKNASPREDATEMPVGGVPVPKTGQKNASPREDAIEVPVGGVPVPKAFRKPVPKTFRRPAGPCQRSGRGWPNVTICAQSEAFIKTGAERQIGTIRRKRS